MTTIATIENRSLSQSVRASRRLVGILCGLRVNLTEAKSRHAGNSPKTADYFYAKQTQFWTEAKSAPAPPIRLQKCKTNPISPNPNAFGQNSTEFLKSPQKPPRVSHFFSHFLIFSHFFARFREFSPPISAFVSIFFFRTHP